MQPRSLGPFSESIRFITNCQERPEIVVPIVGDVIGEVEWHPKEFVLGQSGSGDERSIRVFLDGKAKPSLDSVEISGVDWKVITWNVEPANTTRARAVIKVGLPVPSGFHKGTLRLRFTDMPTEVIEIPLSVVVKAGVESKSETD
jgi:hypothetical protein